MPPRASRNRPIEPEEEPSQTAFPAEIIFSILDFLVATHDSVLERQRQRFDNCLVTQNTLIKTTEYIVCTVTQLELLLKYLRFAPKVKKGESKITRASQAKSLIIDFSENSEGTAQEGLDAAADKILKLVTRLEKLEMYSVKANVKKRMTSGIWTRISDQVNLTSFRIDVPVPESTVLKLVENAPNFKICQTLDGFYERALVDYEGNVLPDPKLAAGAISIIEELNYVINSDNQLIAFRLLATNCLTTLDLSINTRVDHWSPGIRDPQVIISALAKVMPNLINFRYYHPGDLDVIESVLLLAVNLKKLEIGERTAYNFDFLSYLFRLEELVILDYMRMDTLYSYLTRATTQIRELKSIRFIVNRTISNGRTFAGLQSHAIFTWGEENGVDVWIGSE